MMRKSRERSGSRRRARTKNFERRILWQPSPN
nr:MAG TPA: hypothetical protein [Caudoviricetes sp.]